MLEFIRALWWLFLVGFIPGLILAGLFVWHWRGIGPAWSYGAMGYWEDDEDEDDDPRGC